MESDSYIYFVTCFFGSLTILLFIEDEQFSHLYCLMIL